ncbi:hypothetical protein [Sphingopyxis terrae]|uniref:hypothetical protein n=1 Tax=Sphingopyxis terrae TaxID=33052 RepID=UPI00363C2D9B
MPSAGTSDVTADAIITISTAAIGHQSPRDADSRRKSDRVASHDHPHVALPRIATASMAIPSRDASTDLRQNASDAQQKAAP